MTDVFVSYSRRNTDFAEAFTRRLKDKNKSAWVDWKGIPLTSPNWWTEIKRGIEAGDTFVFIMSPDSMASAVCNMELDYAIDLGKRIIPIMYQDVVSKDAFASIADFQPDAAMEERLEGEDILDIARQNWRHLSHINWIFFRESDDFDEAFEKLLKAVDTDLDYVKAHTRYLTRANEWKHADERIDLLLFGEEIVHGERWLTKAETIAKEQKAINESDEKQNVGNPILRPVQRTFIETSRQADVTRRRQVRNAQIAMGLLVAGLIGGLLFAGLIVNRTREEVNAVYAQSELTLAVADQQIADANANLAAVQPTLTTINQQANDAQVALNAVGTEVSSATTKVANAYTVLTPIPVTLTQAAMAMSNITMGRNLALEISNVLIDGQLTQDDKMSAMDNIVVRYPEAELAYQANALFLSNLGQYDVAIANYSQAIRLAEEVGNIDLIPVYYLQRASAYTASGDADSAEADTATARDLFEGSANFSLEYGDYQSAYNTVNSAISYFPDNGTFYNLRATALYLLDRVSYQDDIHEDWERAQGLGVLLADYALSFMDDFANGEVTLTNLYDDFLPVELGRNNATLELLFTDVWTYEGRSGEVLNIQVNADFDTTVSVETVLTEFIAYNDDAPDLPNNNSRIEAMVLPYNGTYYINVASYLNRDGGAYELVVERMDVEDSLPAMPLEMGDNLGTLAPYTQAIWSYTPATDQQVNIRISSDFIPNLALIDPSGDMIGYNDFDENGIILRQLNQVALFDDGTYYILVTTRTVGGAYTLSIEETQE